MTVINLLQFKVDPEGSQVRSELPESARLT